MSVSLGWVAAALRGRALAARTLGDRGTAALASKASLDEAMAYLASSSYGHGLHAGMELEDAQRAVGETALWHLRVLAGWLPPSGVELLRVVASWFEMHNIEDRAVALATGTSETTEAYRMGSLATAWREVEAASSLSVLRTTLAHSDWGDPGADALPTILLGVRIGWSRRLRRAVVRHRQWGDGALALAIAKASFVPDGDVPHLESKDVPELGSAWAKAEGLSQFTESLPPSARWVLDETKDPEHLWKSERLWWARVDRDARRLVDDWRLGRSVVIGAAVRLVTDCARTQLGLQRAARGFGIEETDRASA
jgi:hypothetical protein